MAPDGILNELLRLARRLGIAVRLDTFELKILERRGGLCYVRGAPVIVLDERLPVLDKVAIVAEALAAFDLEVLYLPPLIRARLDRSSARSPVLPRGRSDRKRAVGGQPAPYASAAGEPLTVEADGGGGAPAGPFGAVESGFSPFAATVAAPSDMPLAPAIEDARAEPQTTTPENLSVARSALAANDLSP
jgi:hypothetical protein